MDPKKPFQKPGPYSFVDVLERVADGIHVDFISRDDTAPKRPEREKSIETAHPKRADRRRRE